MSESGKSVFLSYASQDVEAAKRIGETLRSAGVGVWFDAEGGLEHGDEWDAKIRRQIKECVLFIPIISANTQAREEGYFRIEWELAAQRALGIASGVAFILPVVIDGTREPDALVPDRFRAVQWTRLPGGEVSADVKARFLKLWSHRIGVVKHEAAQRGEAAVPPVRPEAKKRGVNLALVAGAVAVLAVGAFFILRRGGAPTSVVPGGVAVTAPGAAVDAPSNESQRLVAQAWEQLNKPELARAELEIADDLCRRATQLDPNSADAWAAWSQVDSWYIYHGFDFTSERREGARKKADTALHLDPKSFEARLAQGCFLVRLGGGQSAPAYAAPAESLLRELRAERPDEPRMLLVLGILLRNTGKWTEMEQVFRRMAQNPNFAAQALSELGWAEGFHGDFPASEAAANASIALRPYWGNLSLKIIVALQWRGDVDLALALLQQIPASIRLEDYGVSTAVNVYTYRREPAKILEVLATTPREWLQSNAFVGPKALLAAQAQDLAGHQEAAKLQRRNALKLVEQRLAAQPDSVFLLHLQGAILAGLGEQEEAEKALRLAREMGWSESSFDEAIGSLTLGKNDEALSLLERAVREGIVRNDISAAVFRLDPRLDPVRKDPRFQALLVRMEADPAFSPDAPATAAVAPATSRDEKSVAVLAFANLSDDKANEYFSDGISEELLTVLQKIPGLHVAARTSSFYFKGRNATTQEIGQKLGVIHLIEGSVRKAGNQVRISVRLSRSDTGEQLWSDSYTRDLRDVFALQTELAQTIVEQLRKQLGGEAATNVAAQIEAAEKGGTRNADAHQFYLQGRYYMVRFAFEDLNRSVGFFQKAVELDPHYARAWATMSQAASLVAGYANTRAEFEAGNALAAKAADRALSLEPDLAVAHLAKGDLQAGPEFDWVGAIESYHRALELAPNDADVLVAAGRMAYTRNQIDRSLGYFVQAERLDPANPAVRTYHAYSLMVAGRFPEAKAEFQEVIALNPSSPWSHGGMCWALVLEGNFDQALQYAQKSELPWVRHFGVALAQSGRHDAAAADAALAELIKSDADVAAYQIAQVYGFRSDADHAFEWLERAYRQRDPGLAWLLPDRLFNSIHADARWIPFVRKLGLAEDQLP